jgi:TIR domain
MKTAKRVIPTKKRSASSHRRQANRFFSSFMSCSSKDHDFAGQLYMKLRKHGLTVWFTPENAQAGRKIHEMTDQAILGHDKLLLILSKNSMKSERVKSQIRKARLAELKGCTRKLFPIRLVDMQTIKEWECIDPDTKKDAAVEIREYWIADFSNWHDPDAFEAAFKRLLEGLKIDHIPSI